MTFDDVKGYDDITYDSIKDSTKDQKDTKDSTKDQKDTKNTKNTKSTKKVDIKDQKDDTKDSTKDQKDTKNNTKYQNDDIKNSIKDDIKNNIKDSKDTTKDQKDDIEDTTKDQKDIKPIKKVDTNLLILTQYYQRYTSSIKARKPSQAINYFINIYNHIEKNPKLFNKAIELFRKNKNILHETIALQGIETVSMKYRFKLEVFYTLLKACVEKDSKVKINFDIVNEIIQNMDLFKEYKKEFNKIKK